MSEFTGCEGGTCETVLGKGKADDPNQVSEVTDGSNNPCHFKIQDSFPSNDTETLKMNERDETEIPEECKKCDSEFSRISNSSPNEIMSVLNKKFDFFLHFQKQDVEKDTSAHLFIILGKACCASYPSNVRNIIRNLNISIKNVLRHLQLYFVLLMKSDMKQIHKDSLHFIVTFMEKYHEMMPSSASEFLSMITPIFNSLLLRFIKSGENSSEYSEIKKRLDRTVEQNQSFLENNSFSQLKNFSKDERLHILEPPNSFRLIPVLPTINDLRLPCTFLRPNIVRGSYKNVEHYLDVQYRLLREDCIMPLREGITEYLNLKKNKESFRHCQNVKVYTNVEIKDEIIKNGNLFHVLHFTSKGFSGVPWDKSKRLLTGSLLCLSFDDFRTMYLATVKIRDSDDLKQGLLSVKFEGNIEDTFNIPRFAIFVVLESSAYFEAYKHNLTALLNLSSEKIPFMRYFIDVEKEVFHPVYLKEATEYNMRPLFGISDQNTSLTVPEIYMNIKVLDKNSWPTATALHLDDSQLNAIKRAVTKEFAIIQGPPGTGKTFIGLKIVELLLENKTLWFDKEKNSLPVLVVCYTNHALDQFLEGLLCFCKQIVRVGGRSSNEKILQYQLHELKSKCFIPPQLWYGIKESKRELIDLQGKIKLKQENIEKSQQYIFDENHLERYMMPNQFKTLQTGFGNGNKKTFTIHDWLGLSSSKFKFDLSSSFELERNNSESLSDDTEFMSEEEDDDAMNLENERNIDFYDFEEDFTPEQEGYAVLKNSDWSESKLRLPEYEVQQYVMSTLNAVEAMTDTAAASVTHVWRLSGHERWKLYKYWLTKFVRDKYSDIIKLQEKLRTKIQEIEEGEVKKDLCVLKYSSVVGMTTNGAAKNRHLVQALNPAILVVEEAAEVLESHIITSLAPNTQHLILIGDQQQLRPTTTMHLLAAKYKMNISLFERMIVNKIENCRLSVQHRMRPEIASLIVPHIYPQLDNHMSVTEFEDILGIKKNVFFISHSFHESSVNDTRSKSNKHEAAFLIGLCKYLILQGYEPSNITILTTYTGQLFLLKEIAKGSIKDVRITVVDNFQGEENDIILISFVRSNDDGIIGFLREPNRVCVALSRARKGFFCIGNFSLFAKKSILWENISKTLVSSQSIGSSLSLYCQNHPDTCTEVASYEDFKKVPDGGCSRKCEIRRLCGHACPFMCHPFDHEKIECQKPCMKICQRNHLCDKKCYQQCFCTVIIERTLVKCGHKVKAFCGLAESEIECQHPCERKCLNDHLCEKKCFEECYCNVIINRTLAACGHSILEECEKPELEIKCSLKCSRVLSCTHSCLKKCGERCTYHCKQPCLKSCSEGHKCQLKCYEYCQCKILVNKTCPQNHNYEVKCFESKRSNCPTLVDRTIQKCGHTIKMPCGETVICLKNFQCPKKCTKILKCSHKCLKKCSDCCETKCKQPCLKTCDQGHSCSKLCYKPCGPCDILVDKTLSRCGHSVTAACGMSEETVLCTFKCEKRLACDHICDGMCGAPCTLRCRQLKDATSPVCGHSLQVECFIFDHPELLEKRQFQLELLGKCSEPCKDMLPCGHECSGTCGSCHQRRIHVPCIAPCSKTLICGHKCVSSCSSSCPPCKQPCENKCWHQTCPRICSEPCVKCRKKCPWSCPHDKCTRLCHEVCNRKLCSEPCTKTLPCSHPCIGFCGEPCPPSCRLGCSNSEKEMLDCDEGFRFVLLEDCGHFFEVLGLNQWMEVSEREDRKLLKKTCPQCGTVIRKSLRYGNIIKNAFLEMEKVKMQIKKSPHQLKNIQLNLRLQSVSLTSTKFFKPSNNISKSLNFARNILELTNIENILSIATIFSKIKMQHDVNGPNKTITQPLMEYFEFNSQWLLSFLLREFLTASEYQQEQLSYEVLRLKLVETLMHLAANIKDSLMDEFINCLKCLLNNRPFNGKVSNSFTSSFRILLSKIDEETSVNCSLPEVPYLKAMNMSIGHWYICLKGHVYCIIDYIGTNGKGCHECMNNVDSRDIHLAKPSDSSFKFERHPFADQVQGSFKQNGFKTVPHQKNKDAGNSLRFQKSHAFDSAKRYQERPDSFSFSRSYYAPHTSVKGKVMQEYTTSQAPRIQGAIFTNQRRPERPNDPLASRMKDTSKNWRHYERPNDPQLQKSTKFSAKNYKPLASNYSLGQREPGHSHISKSISFSKQSQNKLSQESSAESKVSSLQDLSYCKNYVNPESLRRFPRVERNTTQPGSRSKTAVSAPNKSKTRYQQDKQ